MHWLEIVFSSLNLLIIGASVCYIHITLKTNQEWNRRKATHELLNDLIFKEYTELSKVLTVDLGIEINSKSGDYKTALSKFSNFSDKKNSYGF